MIKLPLKPGKLPQNEYRRTLYPWSSCAPFVENSRGVLIHRPMAVRTHTLLMEAGHNKRPHISVHFWCGNATTGGKNITFLEAPPEHSILCERCEQKAIETGLPSAYELTGRHVHVGKLKAVMTCGCAALTPQEPK